MVESLDDPTISDTAQPNHLLTQGLICGASDVCLWAFAERRFGVGCGPAATMCSCTSWFVW